MSKRFLSKKTLALAAVCVAAALPSSALASTCGGQIQTKHSSSWGMHATTFYARGCLVQTDPSNGKYTQVYAQGNFTQSGDAGQHTIMYLTLKDLTDGRTITAQASDRRYEASRVHTENFYVNTPKMGAVAGHKYAVWAWSAPDIDNDGKGRFSDGQSYATWVK